MVATKNRVGVTVFAFLSLAVLIAGCMPAGPRALLDGKRLMDEGQFPEAVEKLKVAASLLSTNAQAWNYLGLAYHRAGQPTNAAASYKRALDLNRELLEARYNLGCLWLEQNKFEAAKSEFTAYTVRRPGAGEGWLKLGTAQLRAGDLNGAEKSCREALRLNPKNVEALNSLALVQLQRKRPRDAVQYLNAALQHQPDYRPALLNLATVLHQHLNDQSGALQKYRQYLALTPKPADAEAVAAVMRAIEQSSVPPSQPPGTNAVLHTVTTVNSSRTATSSVARLPAPAKAEPPPPTKPIPPKPAPVTTQSATTAVEIVKVPPEPLIRTSPDSPALGQPTTNASDVTEPVPNVALSTIAAAPEEKANAAKPGFFSRLNPANLFRRETKPAPRPTSLPTAGKAASSGGTGGVPAETGLKEDRGLVESVPTGKVAGAASTIQSRYTYLSPAKLVAGNRHEAERVLAQGQQQQRARRLPEAMQAFRQATVLDPDYFEAWYSLGLVAYESRSYRQALTAWENALAIQPDSTDARYNFALALKAANYPVDAANELEKILTAAPKETRSHLALGNLCAEQLGDVPRARAHYQKVLELDPRHPQATDIRYWLVAHPNS